MQVLPLASNMKILRKPGKFWNKHFSTLPQNNHVKIFPMKLCSVNSLSLYQFLLPYNPCLSSFLFCLDRSTSINNNFKNTVKMKRSNIPAMSRIRAFGVKSNPSAKIFKHSSILIQTTNAYSAICK